MKNGIIDELINTLTDTVNSKLDGLETDEEKEDFIASINQEKINEIFSSVIENISSSSVDKMKETMFEKVIEFRAIENEFIARLEQKWNRAFVASEAMYCMVLEVAEDYCEMVDSLDDENIEELKYRYIALRSLHGRALQQYLEIVTLMKNGFSDGAYSRWRSMYEVMHISAFILHEDEEVAKAFIDVANSEDRYEWAKKSKKLETVTGKVQFSHIVKLSGVDKKIWDHQYKLANQVVHPSSQATFYRIGGSSIDGKMVIPVGRSDYGLTTPGEHSAIMLAQISNDFLMLFPERDSVLNMKCINKWIDIVREEYFNVHNEIFDDAEKNEY